MILDLVTLVTLFEKTPSTKFSELYNFLSLLKSIFLHGWSFGFKSKKKEEIAARHCLARKFQKVNREVQRGVTLWCRLFSICDLYRYFSFKLATLVKNKICSRSHAEYLLESFEFLWFSSNKESIVFEHVTFVVSNKLNF